MLGHSQISLTADTSTHVMPELQREAAEMMDQVLRRRKEQAPDAAQEDSESAAQDVQGRFSGAVDEAVR